MLCVVLKLSAISKQTSGNHQENCVFFQSPLLQGEMITLSNVQNPYYVPLYWLVDRDPIMVLDIRIPI